jgi:hypothetical protein
VADLPRDERGSDLTGDRSELSARASQFLHSGQAVKTDFHSLPPPSAATSRTNKELRITRITKFASDCTPAFKDVPEPQPAAGEVRIGVKAIGLNRAETAEPPRPMPLSPIGDFCIKVRTTTRSQNGDVMQVLVSDLIVQRRDG